MSRRSAPLLLALLACACGGDAGEGAAGVPSLVLITLDTTNPGALDVYGKDRGVTPNLATLARDSQVFDAARTVAPLTLPSHASMLTGLVPPRHGLRDNGLAALPDEAWTLAEAAQESGRATAAFVSAAVIDAPFGTGQGFDTFDGPRDAGSSAGDYMVERQAPETVGRALAWLGDVGSQAERGFFLWVHFFDPHVPYEAPEEVVRATRGNLYLAEVAMIDHAVGRLLAALPPADECAVVVVADHGESLGRHGEPTHSLLVHDATMHVPLLVRWPGGRAAGTRSDAPVSVCDVFPTAMALLGLEDDLSHDGVDLRDPPGPGRRVYFESYAGYIGFGLAPLAGIADGNGKWIGGPGARLYAGNRPPLDPPNATGAPEDGADVARYREALEAILARPTLDAAGLTEGAGHAMRALGYAGAGAVEDDLPSVLDDTGRPSVEEGLADALATYEAVTVAGVGRRREAIELLQGLARRNPRNAMAAQMLGAFHLEEGDAAEAERVLARLVDRGAAGPEALSLLGEVYLRLGRPADAIPHLKRAADARPGDPKIRERLERARAAR